jgi:acyl-CoA thioesterase-2
MTSFEPDLVSGLSPAPRIEALERILTVSSVGDDKFEGGVSDEPFGGRTYGGQIVAQASAAAGATVSTGRSMHSLHAYFVKPPVPDTSFLFEVIRLREGRNFSLRRVVARQGDDIVLEATISFHARETGWQHTVKMPEVISPGALDSSRAAAFAKLRDVSPNMGSPADFMRSHDFRVADSGTINRDGSCQRKVWFRVGGTLPNNARLHEAALVYSSDFTLLGTAVLPYRDDAKLHRSSGSLDHSLWIHEPFKCDEWLLYVTESTWANNARGFVRGMIFNQDGKLIASVAQEGLIRREE